MKTVRQAISDPASSEVFSEILLGEAGGGAPVEADPVFLLETLSQGQIEFGTTQINVKLPQDMKF